LGRKIPYEENHRIINGELQKKCNKHDIYFPNEEPWFLCTEEFFYTTDKNKTDGLHPECKRCGSKHAYKNLKDRHGEEKHRLLNKIRDATPERKKQMRANGKRQRESGYQKEYQQKNPEKIRQYTENRKNPKEWIACKNYFGNTCAYCGLPILEHYFTRKGVTKLGDFHKEHKDHDGANDLSNCLPSCGSCNDKKWKHPFDEWYTPDNPIFSQDRLNKILKWVNEDYKLYIEENKPRRSYIRKIKLHE
jgi:hypothetical protein